MTNVSEVCAASIRAIHCPDDGGAVRTSETSVNFNVTTWCYIPEDSKQHFISLRGTGVALLLLLSSVYIKKEKPYSSISL
jgi:hypothetical protein